MKPCHGLVIKALLVSGLVNEALLLSGGFCIRTGSQVAFRDPVSSISRRLVAAFRHSSPTPPRQRCSSGNLVHGLHASWNCRSRVRSYSRCTRTTTSGPQQGMPEAGKAVHRAQPASSTSQVSNLRYSRVAPSLLQCCSAAGTDVWRVSRVSSGSAVQATLPQLPKTRKATWLHFLVWWVSLNGDADSG